MKLDRLISILVLLLRKERVQARELAEKFNASIRTILRDVDALNLAGIPIVTYQGINGGIGIAEGYRLDRSVLTEDEMVALITTLRGIGKGLHENGSVTVNATLPENNWLYGFLLSFGPGVEVISPLHIRENLCKFAQEIVQKYSK